MNPISTIPTSEPETSSNLAPATVPTPDPAAERSPTLLGSVMVLIQFDVSEEIHLDDVRNALDARRATCNSSTRLPPMPASVSPQWSSALNPWSSTRASALKASSSTTTTASSA